MKDGLVKVTGSPWCTAEGIINHGYMASNSSSSDCMQEARRSTCSGHSTWLSVQVTIR